VVDRATSEAIDGALAAKGATALRHPVGGALPQRQAVLVKRIRRIAAALALLAVAFLALFLAALFGWLERGSAKILHPWPSVRFAVNTQGGYAFALRHWCLLH
jgi:hypothetical protein